MQHLHTFTGHTAPLYALAHGDGPGRFLSAGGDGRIVAWDLARPDEGTVLATVPRPVFAMHMVAGTDLLLVGTDTGTLHVVDRCAQRELQAFEVHAKGIFRIIAPGDGLLACAGGDGCISTWRIAAAGLERVRQVPLVDAKVRDLAVAPDGRWLAVACGDGTVRVLDIVSFNEPYTVEAHANGATCLAYHPTKPVLLSGGKDGHLRTWHTAEGHRAVHAFPAHGGTIYGLGFSPDHRWLVSVGRDRSVKQWDANDLSWRGTAQPPPGRPLRSVNALLWSGDHLITVGDDRAVHVWRTNNN